jgi:hypothetical protein
MGQENVSANIASCKETSVNCACCFPEGKSGCNGILPLAFKLPW